MNIAEEMKRAGIEILKGEEFKPLPGLEDDYYVSNLGRVLSLNYKKMKALRILKPSKTQKGYPKINLKNKTYLVNRLVWLAFHPEKQGQLFVLGFKDGDHTNVALSNLYEME